MIRNIVFDMGGVLIRFDPSRFLQLLSVSPEDQALLRRAVFQTVEWVQLDRGTLTEADAAPIMKRRLPARLHGAVDRLLCWWELELSPVEGMEALIAELKGLGYGIYLLSNTSLRQADYFGRIPGSQYFDGCVLSARCRLLKPQKEIFDLLLRAYGLSAEECFFIDDLPANVEGALYAGLNGAVFDGSPARLRRALNAAGVPCAAGAECGNPRENEQAEI